MAGTVGAPNEVAKGDPVPLDAPVSLAWYGTRDFGGVLAPKGWKCQSSAGTSGSTKTVALNPDDLSGPSIVLRHYVSEGSGDYGIVDYLARLFPAEGRQWADAMSRAGRLRPSDVKYGPFSGDRLTYRGGHLVEFETPPNREGLGTQEGLGKSPLPTFGVVDLVGKGDDVELVFLAVRLEPDDVQTRTAIVSWLETSGLKPRSVP